MPGTVVQERMGHSSITITMDTYGHLFPRGDDTAEMTAAEEGVVGPNLATVPFVRLLGPFQLLAGRREPMAAGFAIS